jgi:hypothetical protein
MSSPQGPSQHNQQYNNASNGGFVYANQGPGKQSINHHYNVVGARTRTGWAILVLLAVDVGFFIYGMTAYTGLADDSGDLWRAGISVVLLGVTLRLIRRWFRQRL